MEVFHHYNENHCPSSAEEIVPKIINLFNPQSVIDIGCGIGQWLSVFKDKGVENILGLDGEHVLPIDLLIPKINFREVDFTKCNTTIVNSKYDLVLCLEVAEHLPEPIADSFISMLASCGDTILFSAAIPGQTGENHYNEQWPTYWEEKFKKHGYYFYDLLREDIWSNEKVNWWYRQNIFIVSKKTEVFEKYSSYIFKGQLIVHPELLNMYMYMNEINKQKKKSFNRLKKIYKWMKFQ